MPSRSVTKKLVWAIACAGAMAFAVSLLFSARFWGPALALDTWSLGEPLPAPLREALAAALIATALVGVASVGAVHVWVLRRVKRLAGAMKRAGEGDCVVRADVRGADEISGLANAFNQMLAQLTELRAREIDNERDLVAAQEQISLKRQLETANAQAKKRVAELSLLCEMAQSFTSTLQLSELLARITPLLAERLKLPHVQVLLTRPDGQLELKSMYPAAEAGAQPLRFGAKAGNTVATSMSAVYVPILGAPTGPDGQREVEATLLSVPMIHGESLLGILNFQRPGKNAFSKEEMDLFNTVTAQAALAIKNAILHAETVALSLTDPLTGAPNRRHLLDRLELEVARAHRFGTQLSVLMIDVDHFKHLNDTAGHRAGDVVLKQLYEIMKSKTRNVDVLGRYGGEEFVLVLPQVPKAEAAEVADKLRRAVAQHPFPEGAGQPGERVTISVGVASLPADGTEAPLLIDCADAAMYASKRGGRDQVTVYAAGMEQHPGRERNAAGGRKVRAVAEALSASAAVPLSLPEAPAVTPPMHPRPLSPAPLRRS